MTNVKRITTWTALIGLLLPTAQVSAGIIDFAATRSGQFGTLNLQTAVFTQSGNPGTGFEDLGRIAGGPLYAADSNANLLTLNTSNGSTTSSVSVAIGVAAISVRSDGVLFGTNSTSLYTINPTTGAATLIGSLGISGATYFDLRFDTSGHLYFTSDSGSTATLYSINTTSGAATLIGSIGAAVGVLDYENGTLYGVTLGPATQQLYTINPTTGAGTLAGTVTGAPGPIYGLATMDAAAVPEPSAAILGSFTCLVGLGYGWLRRRQAAA